MSGEQKLFEEQVEATPETEALWEASSHPTTRASIDKRKVKARPPHLFTTGAKVLMRRSSTDIFEDYMIVTEPVFDEDRNGWVYRLKEDSSTGLSWPKKVKETNLKRRR